MTSKRLKNKPLLKINNSTLIETVIKRAKMVFNNNEIILATSILPVDDILVSIAEANKINFFRGALNNVVLRTYKCVEKFNLDAFLRICGDRPFFDINDAKKSIALYKSSKGKIDMVSSELHSKSISGLITELISKKTISIINSNAKTKDMKEHITKYVYLNKSKFNIVNLKNKNKNSNSNIKLSVDYLDDLKRARFISKNIKSANRYDTVEIKKIAKKWK